MPSIEEDGWELESAEDRFATSNGKFEMPTRVERESLRVGDRCKLLFLFLVDDEKHGQIIGCERMWVRVEQLIDQGYLGTLESNPQYSDLIEPGSVIGFRPEHVASILVPRSDPRHHDFEKQ